MGRGNFLVISESSHAYGGNMLAQPWKLCGNGNIPGTTFESITTLSKSAALMKEEMVFAYPSDVLKVSRMGFFDMQYKMEGNAVEPGHFSSIGNAYWHLPVFRAIRGEDADFSFIEATKDGQAVLPDVGHSSIKSLSPRLVGGANITVTLYYSNQAKTKLVGMGIQAKHYWSTQSVRTVAFGSISSYATSFQMKTMYGPQIPVILIDGGDYIDAFYYRVTDDGNQLDLWLRSFDKSSVQAYGPDGFPLGPSSSDSAFMDKVDDSQWPNIQSLDILISQITNCGYSGLTQTSLQYVAINSDVQEQLGLIASTCVAR